MTLLGIVLAYLAHLDEVSGVGEGHWLVKAMSEGFPHEGAWCHVVSADAAMDVEEQLPPSFGVTHRWSTLEVLWP